MIKVLKYANLILITLILFNPLIEIFAQEQITKEQVEIKKLNVEIEKLQKETELLEFQVKENSDLAGQLVKNIPLIISVFIPIAGTAAITFLAWRRERKIPPAAEQEKVILDLAKEWFYHHYLVVYNKIWKEIKDYEKINCKNPMNENEKNKHDEFIKLKWTELCATKEFPKELFDKNKSEEMHREEFIESLAKKLNKQKDSDLKELEHRLELIGNSSNTDFYDKVLEKLPILIEYSINASLEPDKKLSEINRENLREESLKKLQRLMIFTRIREDPVVIETLLDAKLNEKLSKIETLKSELKPTDVNTDQ